MKTAKSSETIMPIITVWDAGRRGKCNKMPNSNRDNNNIIGGILF